LRAQYPGDRAIPSCIDEEDMKSRSIGCERIARPPRAQAERPLRVYTAIAMLFHLCDSLDDPAGHGDDAILSQFWTGVSRLCLMGSEAPARDLCLRENGGYRPRSSTRDHRPGSLSPGSPSCLAIPTPSPRPCGNRADGKVSWVHRRIPLRHRSPRLHEPEDHADVANSRDGHLMLRG
jgi:hypothetical protein